MSAVELTIEKSSAGVVGQAWCSIKVGDIAIFTELVYDNEEGAAERNILLLFGSRLRHLLSDDE